MLIPLCKGRRAVCFGIASAWTGVCAARASKEKARERHIGVLSDNAPGASRIEQMLRELSTADMQIAVEVRVGTGADIQRHATSLVANKVDLIFASGTPAAQAAQRATTSIPIVYSIAGDPIAAGLASTLARPGGNSTGVYAMAGEVSGKRVSLLRDAVPRAKRIGLLWDPNRGEPEFNTSRVATESMGATVIPLAAMTKGELLGRFNELPSLRIDALSVLTTPMLFENLQLVAELALQNRMPAIAAYLQFADLGGLMSYSANLIDTLRSAVAQADRILKGARPMDLPVQRSQTFVLSLNLKTAASLGVPISEALAIQAQRVIR